jgi:hypothetical protein
MPINNSGLIALGSGSLGQSINLQLGKSMTAYITMNDNDVRVLAGKVGINPISFSDFYGKPVTPSITPSRSATPPVTPTPTPTATRTPTPTPTPSQIPSYYYTITYCSSIQTQIISSVTLTPGVFYFGNDGQCFYVDSQDGPTFFSPTITGATVITDCSSGLCIS